MRSYYLLFQHTPSILCLLIVLGLLSCKPQSQRQEGINQVPAQAQEESLTIPPDFRVEIQLGRLRNIEIEDNYPLGPYENSLLELIYSVKSQGLSDDRLLPSLNKGQQLLYSLTFFIQMMYQGGSGFYLAKISPVHEKFVLNGLDLVEMYDMKVLLKDVWDIWKTESWKAGAFTSTEQYEQLAKSSGVDEFDSYFLEEELLLQKQIIKYIHAHPEEFVISQEKQDVHL